MRELICKEGYKDIKYVCDKPDADYGLHSHPKDTKYVILEGGLQVTTDGDTVTYKTGDSFKIKAEKEHRSLSLENGCCYFVGEK